MIVQYPREEKIVDSDRPRITFIQRVDERGGGGLVGRN